MEESTIFLVASPEFQMPVTFPCIVDGVPISDPGQEWSWILGEWVECETIERQEKKLRCRQYRFEIDLGEHTYVTDKNIVNEIALVKKPIHPAAEPEDSIVNIPSSPKSKYRPQKKE